MGDAVSIRPAPESEEKKRPRVVIAEDFVLIQEHIRGLLQSYCQVVAAVEDGQSALDAVATYGPDILLLDVSLPVANGFAVTETLRQSQPEVKVVFITAHRDRSYVERAFELGAKGYVLKTSMHTDLLPAIRKVSEGGVYRSALVA